MAKPRPLTSDPRPPAPRVLLIQQEWPARALIKAELEWRGCDVLAAPTPSEARALSRVHGFRPTIAVVDAVDLSPHELDILVAMLVPRDYRLIVLLSTQQSHDVVTKLSAEEALIRPFSIGNIVDVVVDS